MNFGDKLIKLRKKEGMSQEELGDKLGVTRQTVSKWELGQTTPEMDKLKDISTLFNISVNYLVNDNYGETEESRKDLNEPEGGKSAMDEKQNGTRKILLIVAVVIIGIGLLAGIFNYAIFKNFFGFAEDIVNNDEGGAIGVFDKATDIINDTINGMEDSDKRSTTNTLKMYIGTQSSYSIGSVIDEVVDNNNQNKDYQIKLELDGVEYTDAEEMIGAKSTLDSAKNYEVMYKYDDNGYIIQAIIK